MSRMEICWSPPPSSLAPLLLLLPLLGRIMAPIELTILQQEAAMAKGSSDLKYLFARENIEENIQAVFFHIGIVTTSNFASFAESQTDLKLVLKESVDLDSAVALEQRVKIASIVTAWDLARKRTDKQAELEGDYDSKKLVKPLPMSEYSGMLAGFRNRWWDLDSESTPARCYVERRSDDLESGDMRAESLTTVLQRDQEDPDVLTTSFDATGKLLIKKGTNSIAEPGNPEALRRRIKIMGYTLIMLGLKHTNRSWLQNITPQLFEEFLSYILGEHVFGLTGKSSEGHTVSSPCWNQILIYEFQIRKSAYDRVHCKGESLTDALKTCWSDPIIKERYLTTPMALSSLSIRKPASAPQQGGGTARTGPYVKGKGKGKGKGRGKGKGKGRKGGKGGKSSVTPDGRPICFAYNNPNERCGKSCPNSFVHVCAWCFGLHPAFSCPGNGGAPVQPETQGMGNGSQ